MPAHPAATDRRPLADAIRRFIVEPHYAALATLDDDGHPRQALVWYRLDADDTIVVNSRVGRRWPANLRRDARVALAVMDEREPERWVGLTGRVVAVVEEQEVAQADIAGLARRYHSPEEAEASIAEFRTQKRVSFRIRIDGVHVHL